MTKVICLPKKDEFEGNINTPSKPPNSILFMLVLLLALVKSHSFIGQFSKLTCFKSIKYPIFKIRDVYFVEKQCL